jgi:hypothetical protein
MTQFPLARYFGPDSVVARGPGTVVTLCQRLGDIETPARTLPERKYVINLCEDRYLFLTGVAAAMVRGQVSLLPSARTPHALYELAEVYPDLYCLCERPDGIPEGLEVALGHSISSARYPSTTMPAFPVQTGYAFHLTHKLLQIKGVIDGVFFMPDEGQEPITRPLAFAVAPRMTAAEILKELRQYIDPVFLPRPLILLDALPRNAVGKLPRKPW